MRFPEFTEDWVKYKISNICKIATGNKNTQDKEDDGLYPFYVRSQNVERINSWTFDGEAILTAGDGVGVGKVFHYSLGKIGVHQRVYILSDFNCNGKFLYSYFSSRFYNRVKRMSAKNSVDSVRMEMIADMPISIPKEREQIKIGDLLSLLDQRIATQNKIIEDLKKLKVAICNKLIDNLVNREPLICFSEVYSKAGEGGTPETSKSEYYENGNIPFIKIDDLSNKYIISNKDFITELGLQKSSAWIIPTHSLIYSNGATIGAISINTYEVCTKQGILGIVPKTSISVEYLYCLMSSNYFSKQVHRIITHGTMATAYLKDINKIKVPIPCMQKQLKIANTISSITNIIETELNILSLLLKQKQYLLQQMFI